MSFQTHTMPAVNSDGVAATDEELTQLLKELLWRPTLGADAPMVGMLGAGDTGFQPRSAETRKTLAGMTEIEDFLPLTAATKEVLTGIAARTIRIFVPYTYVQNATMTTLSAYLYNHYTRFIDLSGDPWNYVNYFQDRWEEERTFVNVEHDMVPWPGAIEEIWNCPEQWCFYDYTAHPGVQRDWLQGYYPMIGLTKFSAAMIERLPDVWRDLAASYLGWQDQGIDMSWPWGHCDSFLAEYAAQHNVFAHQHWPSVPNVKAYRDSGGQPPSVRIERVASKLSGGTPVDWRWFPS